MEDLHKEFSERHSWYAKWHTIPFISFVHFGLLIGIGYSTAQYTAAAVYNAESQSAAVAQAAPQDDTSSLSPHPGTDFGPWFKMSQWGNCSRLMQQGRIFEIQNGEGQSMWSECTSQVPKAPFDWHSSPVRFRLIKEPLPRHEPPIPPPLGGEDRPQSN